MKKLLIVILSILLLLVASAAFSEESAAVWSDSSAEEIMNSIGVRFNVPADAVNVSYQAGENAAQMIFTLNDIEYTARIQPTTSFENISGYEFDPWAISDECMIGWCDAQAMMAQTEEGIVALCLWYDAAPGLMYSVSACAEDLKGLDIQSAAEAVFIPSQSDADGLTASELQEALIACTGYAGTAGSSLKNAIAACNLASFAAEKQAADLNELFLSEIITDAVNALTEEQVSELSFNLESIHSVLTDAFTDYAASRDLFDTAGIAEEMDRLIAAQRTFEHYSALYDQLLAAGL